MSGMGPMSAPDLISAPLTWGQVKRAVEALGVLDNQVIFRLWIDGPYPVEQYPIKGVLIQDDKEPNLLGWEIDND